MGRKMDNLVAWVLALLIGVGLVVFTLIVGLETIIFNDAYFEWHYENRGITETTGMTVDDLMIVTDHMLAYLKDENDDLAIEMTMFGQVDQVFGETEIAHMVDVKDLYLKARWLRRIGAIMMFVALVVLMGDHPTGRYRSALKKVKWIVLGEFGVLAVVAGLFATDFQKYFTFFHQIFFSNDLWLLNPKTDTLINMVPESYFYSIVMIGVAIFVVYLVVGLAVIHKLHAVLEK